MWVSWEGAVCLTGMQWSLLGLSKLVASTTMKQEGWDLKDFNILRKLYLGENVCKGLNLKVLEIINPCQRKNKLFLKKVPFFDVSWDHLARVDNEEKKKSIFRNIIDFYKSCVPFY